MIDIDIRVLKYFLMAAREENITKAARLLHLTQPTLSRQLMQLEDELGVKLFNREKHSISLTEDGMLLKRRAQEIVDLTDRTVREFCEKKSGLAGEISVGCGETKNMSFLAQQIAVFRKTHPLVHFNIYTANADDIKEKIENGTMDLGLLMEPVNIEKYEFIRMPYQEQWCALVRDDSALAGQETVSPDDLTDIPLIGAWRDTVKGELSSWFGERYEKLEIVANYNLVLNAAMMVHQGVGTALCLMMNEGYGGIHFDGLKFLPFKPKLETGAVLAWKKNQAFPPAVAAFISDFRNAF